MVDEDWKPGTPDGHEECDTCDKAEEAARFYYSEIMRQLMDAPRFQDWFQCNYDVHQMINDETKTIEVLVMETRAEVALERMEALLRAKRDNDKPSILTATEADLKAIDALAKGKT
jgi:hypothetical protein